MSKKIFVTGGAGYIGSHSCLELLKHDYEVMIFDNFSNGSKKALHQVEHLANKKLKFIYGDVRDEQSLLKAMCKFSPHTVLHFAGLKAVGESVCEPLKYYNVNVSGSLNVLRAATKAKCLEFIFSSSATVYGHKKPPPFSEFDELDPVSPYGRTKLFVEMILKDWVNSNLKNRAIILRYFNPVGADASGLIGEDQKENLNNLMPYIVQVASGKRNYLPIFGDDYSTRDGTGERDYIHVSDVAKGHVKSIKKIQKLERFQIINLGTGKGRTVLELLKTFEKVNKVNIPFKILQRRPGDVAKLLANPEKASRLIDFKCEKTIEDMCIDSWNWQKKFPCGYLD